MSLVAIAGGKGAPGSTFVAINVAAALSAERGDVLLVDLDPHGGDISALLGLYPRSGLYPLMRLEGKRPSIESVLREAQVREGLSCIAGFPRAEDADLNMIDSVIDSLSNMDRPIIADLGRIVPASAHLFSKADAVVVVVRADMTGVYAARRAIQTLDEAGCDASRITAVVNGWEWKRSGDLAESVEALKARVIGSVPLDRRETRRALLDQRSLRKGRAFKAFRSLAHEVQTLVSPRENVPALT